MKYRHFPGQTTTNPNNMRINLPWLLHLPHNRTVRDYSFARRFVRSTLNPPAHPCDGLGRVGPGCPYLSYPPKSLLAGVRVARRGKHLHHFFYLFFDSIFFAQNPSQGLPKGFPRDPKIDQKSSFSAKSLSQEPFFGGLLFPTLFSSFFWSILARFSIKNSCVFRRAFANPHAFFSTCRPSRSIVKTNTQHTF